VSGPGVRTFRSVAGVFVIVCVFGACHQPDDIVVHVDPNNKPPTFVAQGPELPTGPMEVIGTSAPGLWVLVGDPNGLDDISAVLLDVQTIRLHSIIIRPASTTGGGCDTLDYTPNGNIDVSASVPVPIDIGQLKSVAFSHDQGGIYRANPFVIPQLYKALPVFGRVSGCATGSASWLDWLVLLPPAAASPTDVFLTYVDVEFIGISVTVYDSAGTSAKTTFPNLRVVFTTTEEKTVAP
jgi:hypothetical protein